MSKLLAIVCSVALLSGCATVTMRPEGTKRLAGTPTSTQSFDFFFWGLTPEEITVDLKRACRGGQVAQFQSQSTLQDSLLSIVTFGIYAPRSVRIWCE